MKPVWQKRLDRALAALQLPAADLEFLAGEVERTSELELALRLHHRSTAEIQRWLRSLLAARPVGVQPSHSAGDVS